MSPAIFRRSLSSKNPPAGLSPALRALWWAGKDDWHKAHKIVMNEEGADCAWVHAYLHRVEGDLDNAVLVSAGAAQTGDRRSQGGMDHDRRRTPGETKRD